MAFAGAIYTALQYQRAKRARALDLSISFISQLDTVPELSFACQALDWGVGPMIVPERYRPLLEARRQEGSDTRSPGERGEVLEHDTSLMTAALEPYLNFDYSQCPAGLVYRYCFDKLFQHLSNIERLVAGGQLDLTDLGILRYWLERIAIYEYPPSDVPGDLVFQPFLSFPEFGYGGVMTLGKRLGVSNWTYGPRKQGCHEYGRSSTLALPPEQSS